MTRFGSSDRHGTGEVYGGLVESGGDPGHRAGELAWAQLSAPDQIRSGEVSWAKLTIPEEFRNGDISWVALTTPSESRQGQASWVRMSVPRVSRHGDFSWAKLSFPGRDRIGELSWARLSVTETAEIVTYFDIDPKSITLETIGAEVSGTSEYVNMKQGDTLPVIRTLAKDGNGTALTGLASADVRFHMSNRDGVQVDGQATGFDTVQTDDEGNEYNVEYQWQDGDTDKVGTFNAEFEINYAGGGRLTAPNDNDNPYLRIRVKKELA